MGSDCSPLALYKAIEHSIQNFPSVELVLLVTQAALNEFSQLTPISELASSSRITFQIVTEFIAPDEDPIAAFRKKKNSSISLGLMLLKNGYLQALVSVGNTGALVVGATLSLPLLLGVIRPALLALLPTEKGSIAIIDVGGNVSHKAFHLVQFARLGAAYQRCSEGIERPRVGILNIGVEPKKGTAELRKAYQEMLKPNNQINLKFIGNVEGYDIFKGIVDVLVTDGFTGNIFLKTSEGVSRFMLKELSRTLNTFTPNNSHLIMENLSNQFNDEEYNGALICGLEHIIIKCHGMSSWKGLYNGIKRAITLVQNNFINEMKKELE